jgi:hypothetical protein
MATPRYGTRGYRGGGRRPSLIELSLALSVIVGLLYVSMRIMSMPVVAVHTDTVAVMAAPDPDANTH